ncbi:MAG: SpoIIE family protein phosphatase [Bacteroidales bacterium]|jgi:ligand-binding sensor domain-containing protein/serine phosphatase RsbU (regulator of sigma subunit)|nr:SpoIIE family protein phosphatase [Bacteroidales bacterium]
MPRSLRSATALFCVFLAQVLFPAFAQAQTYSYRTYDEYTGLPGSYLNVIEQDKDGLLWVGVDTGLYRYDGFSFHHMPFSDTLPRGNASALYCDVTGTMWVGMSDGSLFTWKAGESLKRIILQETDKINRITRGPEGKVWIVTQTSGIYIAEPGGGDRLAKITMPGEMTLFDVAFTGDGRFLAATQDNLHLCSLEGEGAVSELAFPDLEYTWIQTIVRMDDDTWFAGTGDKGLWLIRRVDGILTAKAAGDTIFMNMNIPALAPGPGRSITIATLQAGALKATFSSDFSGMKITEAYDVSSGLPENNVRTLFRDREGNLWIGLFSRGLAAVTTNAFSFYKPETSREITYIGASGRQVIAGTRSGLYEFNLQTGSFTNFRPLTAKTGGSGIASWTTDDRGNIWIGTAGGGAWMMKPDRTIRQIWLSTNPGQNHINSVAVENENVWLGTSDGVILLDRETGRQKAVYTTLELLPHNYVSQLVVNRPGEVLVATKSDRLCYIHVTGGVRTEGMVMEGSRVNEIRSISVAPDRTVCAGTNGNGLFLFAGDTLLNYTEADGLLTNFCYSAMIASDGRIWTGHQKGFSIVNPSTGSVRAYSTEFGVRGDCLPNAITQVPDGTIYIGTTEGVVVYNPSSEPDTAVPPQAGIISVVINNTVYPYRESYNLPYRKSYSVKVNYAGILLRDPLNVVFRTRLDNFDGQWSEITSDRSVTYNLRDGHYRFNVEALTRDDPGSATSASFSLVIQKPVTDRWWFILSMLVLMAGVVYIIVRLRERAHRKQREFLENELQKRTAEVYEQKEELAQKNLDITESIKYAKRIQSSVLPDTARLGSVFREAFVFFLPRDIVSGDFYWFDWVDKDRFVVVCSDSTGHGVPGAFMSMIGTALLQDIITVKKITRPSQVLHELDRQIFSTLNQNQELEASNDGMDIVVCEFNLTTRQLVFSSAMRPVILVIDGVQHYVRGNRSSVGGESVTEKFYDDQEYHLREGDMVYLFTDGYCDQFGGTGGKKMKISRLKTLIDDITPLNAGKQQKQVKDFFYEWMGSNEQVDDVLFMGIRV